MTVKYELWRSRNAPYAEVKNIEAFNAQDYDGGIALWVGEGPHRVTEPDIVYAARSWYSLTKMEED